MINNVFAHVDNYISNLFPPDDPALVNAAAAIDASGIPSISVSPNQGKFLYMLATLCRAERMLEVGTLGGYSTIWMAKALPVGGKLITLEIDPQHAAVAQKNIDEAGLSHKVEIRIGKAIELLPVLLQENGGPFDMIFIDADKPPYAEYLAFALKLSRRGTLIVTDNVIREGKVLDEKSTDPMVIGAHRFNKLLGSTDGVTATIIQTVGSKEHDGMALAIVD